jgi:hypothetical protein
LRGSFHAILGHLSTVVSTVYLVLLIYITKTLPNWMNITTYDFWLASLAALITGRIRFQDLSPI